MLDRLESSALIERQRSTTDRRWFPRGSLLPGSLCWGGLDEPVVAMHDQLLGHMSEDQLRTLIALLALARDGVARQEG